MPMAGSQPSLSANRMTSIKATQNVGMETPTSAMNMQMLSIQLP